MTLLEHSSLDDPPRAPVPPAPVPAAPISVTRRRALPGGRAVIGGLLVTVAVLGTFALSVGRGAQEGRRVVVAARPLAAGQAVTLEDLAIVRTNLPADQAAGSFADPLALRDMVTVAPIAAGELVQRSAVSARTDAPGLELLTLALERARALDGDIEPGAVVRVLATVDGCTRIVARRAIVRDRPARTDRELTTDEVIVRLGLSSTQELVEVSHAAEAGKVMLARSTRDGEPAAVAPICSAK